MTSPNFFTSGSPFLQHPLLTQERTAAEVDFVIRHANIRAGAAVLDIGCGFGRHTFELASRGYSVVGIDPSQAMITAARFKATQLSASAQNRLSHICASAEEFSSQNNAIFDAGICLMTTMGQISDDGPTDHTLLQAARKALRPGANLIIELPNIEMAIAGLRENDRFGDAERYTQIHRQYDPASQIVSETFDVVTPEQSNHFLLKYRLYTQAEVDQLLAKSGLKCQHTFGGFDDRPLTSQTASAIFVCA